MKDELYIANLIAEKTGIEAEKIAQLIAIPPEEKMGDFALPCFSFAKTMRRSPVLISDELAESLRKELGPDSSIGRVESVKGYLNFYMNRAKASSKVVSEILEKREEYGNTDIGGKKTVIVEFSSPNIAKPFHIGHLCSTAIGNSLSKIYDTLGYNVVRINHLGDWGTQFGKLISAYKRWGDRDTILADPINELLKIYVRFHEEAEKDPSLEDEARHYFKLLEEGDEEVTELWQFFKDASMKEFSRMYKKLGIEFDSYAGESFYSDKMPEVVQILQDKGLLEESEGAQIVRFDDDKKLPPCIILKSDGSTIYATRDVAAAIYRKRTYDFYKNIYVVGIPQALHFKQVFSIIEKMGFDWADSCVHVGFGYVRFPDRVLSTRHGDVVLLEDVLNESIAKTKEIIEKSNSDIENIDEVSEKIGIGAILYTFLKNGREKDIIFTWDDILDFEGESGPYVQYTYARGRSILRKARAEGVNYENADLSLLTGDSEYKIVKMLAGFGKAIQSAADKNEPCQITRYITDVAQEFNKFYNNCNIMKSEEGLRDARLALTESACICIKKALGLLGIETVERM
ncbi:MAG: arginine--tRNA ligase [Clostridia bacterium]|nr:arginine--tRNA ligase [Clostridia bacterium]